MRQRYMTETAVVAIAINGAETGVRWYADLVAGHRASRVITVFAVGNAAGDLKVRDASGVGGLSGLPLREALTRLSALIPIGFLVADWGALPDPHAGVARLALEWDVPCVFVREGRTRTPVRRVQVAASGGPHTIRQFWIAQKAATVRDVPLRIFHLNAPGEAAQEPQVETFYSHLCGFRGNLEVESADDVVRGILDRTARGDLLVLGAPSPLFLTQPGAESIPARVAAGTDAPLLLLLARRTRPIRLRRLFWGQLIRPDYRPADKEEAIAGLIDALVRHNQVPALQASTLLARALRDERTVSTAADCETAFPRVVLPGFHGVAASFGICRDGLDFGGPYGRQTRFIFFLVSAEGYHDEYLGVLAKIARRLIRSEVREALLAARTPAEALDALEPRESMPAAPDPTGRAAPAGVK